MSDSLTSRLTSGSLLPLILTSACFVWGQPGTITTIAGGYIGDGGPAMLAGLSNPAGMALASDGTLYVADAASHRIRKVSTDGMISTFAGNGTSGHSGDGGPAVVAQLNYPRGLALGPDGSLYVADTANHVIRRVDEKGRISTIAGATRGFGGDGGPAASASFAIPSGIAFDTKGRLYIADTGNNRIRMVNENGIVSTLAGNGESGFGGDGSLAVNAKLNHPQSVALAGDGSYFISDMLNYCVRFVDASGRISTVAGGGKLDTILDGPAVKMSLNGIGGLAIGKRGLYIANFGRISLLSSQGKLTALVRARSVVDSPQSLIVTADETIYYSDSKLKLVGRIAGNKAYAVAGAGRPLDAITEPTGLQFGEDGALYVADTSHGIVRRVAMDRTISTIAGTGVSEFGGDGGPAIAAFLTAPLGMAVSGKSLYIADDSRVRVIGPDGNIRTFAGSGSFGFDGDGGPAEKAKMKSTGGLLRLKDGTILIADPQGNRIRAVSPDEIISTFAGVGTSGFGGDGGPATSASLSPVAMAVAKDGSVFVSGNSRVRRIDSKGMISTVVGVGGSATNALRFVSFLAFGPDGALYIADSGNNRIRKLDAAGNITTVVGSGVQGFGGDGGPATEAKLFSPRGLAFGSDGALYFSDWGNDRIRRVDLGALSTDAKGSPK